MIKRMICALLALLLVLSLAACGTDTPDAPDVPGTTEPNVTEPNVDDPDVTEPAVQDHPITAEDLVGCYLAKEETDSYIQIRQWGDCFTIEYLVYDSDGFAWLWAEEFWPNADGWPTTAGQPVEGRSQVFTMVTDGVLFDDQPKDCSIALTETGITIIKDDFAEEYVRDDSYPGNHTPTDDLVTELYAALPDLNRDNLAGAWYYDGDIGLDYMELNEDGSCLYIHKPLQLAPQIYEGAWGISGEYLVLWVEQLGTYDYPMQIDLLWRYDAESDTLGLYDETLHVLRDFGSVWMNRYTPDADVNLTQFEALGYVEMMFEGYDADYYFYEVPRVIGYTETVHCLNEEIYNDFGCLAEQGMIDYEAGQPIQWPNVEYEMFWNDTVITLVLGAYGDEGQMHKAYYYDTLTDTPLYPADMLTLWGIDQEAYLESLREAAASEFEYCHVEYSEEDLEELGADACLAWTLSEDNLNLNRPVYMDAAGTIITYIQIETVYGCYWVPIYLMPEDLSAG